MDKISSNFDSLKKRLQQKAEALGRGNSPRSAAIHQFYLKLAPGRKQWLEEQGKKFDDKQYKKDLAILLSVYDMDDLRVLYYKCSQARNFAGLFWWHFKK